MDFLEGILLGPDFSDTIYQNVRAKKLELFAFLLSTQFLKHSK